jgi:hypothetical protein
MSTKQTGSLHVLTNLALSENQVVINPNDGFDLGLMMTEAAAELTFKVSTNNSDGTPIIDAKIIQKNECKLGTVELGVKSMDNLKGITKVKLILEGGNEHSKLIITSA